MTIPYKRIIFAELQHSHIIMKLIFWIFSLFSLIIPSDPPSEGVLRVSIENVKKSQGKIMLAVYDEEEYFLSEVTFRSIQHEVSQSGVVKLEIDDLPYGTYAISLYHDENNNGKMDANFMKIPKEPYGFSNNARGMFGPPKFKDAQFSFDNTDQEIRIEIK